MPNISVQIDGETVLEAMSVSALHITIDGDCSVSVQEKSSNGVRTYSKTAQSVEQLPTLPPTTAQRHIDDRQQDCRSRSPISKSCADGTIQSEESSATNSHEKKCSVDGCNAPREAREMCRPHLQKWYWANRHGYARRKLRAPKNDDCGVPNCNKAFRRHVRDGDKRIPACDMHSQRWRKYRSFENPPRVNQTKPTTTQSEHIPDSNVRMGEDALESASQRRALRESANYSPAQQIPHGELSEAELKLQFQTLLDSFCVLVETGHADDYIADIANQYHNIQARLARKAERHAARAA